MEIPSVRKLESMMHHEIISFCEFELGIDVNDPRLDKSTYVTLRESMLAIAREKEQAKDPLIEHGVCRHAVTDLESGLCLECFNSIPNSNHKEVIRNETKR